MISDGRLFLLPAQHGTHNGNLSACGGEIETEQPSGLHDAEENGFAVPSLIYQTAESFHRFMIGQIDQILIFRIGHAESGFSETCGEGEGGFRVRKAVSGFRIFINITIKLRDFFGLRSDGAQQIFLL